MTASVTQKYVVFLSISSVMLLVLALTIFDSFRYAEQKAKELVAKREQAREQRLRDWDPVRRHRTYHFH